SNTDLYTGSFPADYGNAVGGVFDVRFRNGNTEKRAHSIQAGVLGVGIATEGPIGKSGNTSYLANYRYSTTGILSNFFPVGVVPIFQDLSFKIHHKGKNGEQVNVFGLGGIAFFRFFPELDTAVWDEVPGANGGTNDTFRTFTVGASWQKPLSEDTYLKVMGVGTGLEVDQRRWFQNRDLVTGDTTRRNYDFDGRLTFSAFINHRFNARHTHRSGLMVHGLYTNGYMRRSAELLPNGDFSGLMDTLRVGQGTSTLFQAYSRSQFYLNEAWQLNAGLHLMYFPYTGEVSLEPRMGVRWQLRPDHNLALSYGLHSQVEPLFAYVSRRPALGQGNALLTNDLRFNKAHHVTLGWFHQINARMRMGVEAYYQHHFNLVVGEDVPVSRMSGIDFLFETFNLNNGGRGRNYGIEASLERSFSQGYYFFANGSLFEANYIGNDGIVRPSLYNAGLVSNIVGGKEWVVGQKKGKQNLLSVNLSATYSGPQRYTPLDLDASIATGRFEYLYSEPNSSDQEALFFLDASMVYKFNRPRSSSELTIQLNNVLNQRPVLGELYDADNQEVDQNLGLGFFPLLSWRINF
ncbi:MAG: TonB-dependent receptor, partial [Bacteroidota bacterium]